MEVGVIGFGAMGKAMAGHIRVRGNHNVTAFDVDAGFAEQAAETGVLAGTSIAGVAGAANHLLLMVATDAQVETVVNELLEAGVEGKLLIIASTNHPDLMRDLSKQVEAAGGRFIDAPVVFGLQGAEDGDLVSLCGGRARDVDDARTVMECYSKNVFHMGPIGSGQLTKTVNNMLHWSSCVANFEAISLGKRYGLNGQRLREVLLECPAQNGTLERWDTTRFTWHEKDMDIALELAQDADLMLPLFGQVDQLIKGLKPPQVRGLLHEEETHYLGRTIRPLDDS
jgi:3-hydroxyisobutyrate dehydrogenase-like beta-hydroxyacid dehydrogenase